MTYIVEIPDTAESKGLIHYLKTLKYVRFKKGERKVLTEKEMVKAIKAAEKGKKIKWEDAEKIIDSW